MKYFYWKISGYLTRIRTLLYSTIHFVATALKEFKSNVTEDVVVKILIPSSYSQVKESELIEMGVNVVIYANHLIRSAYPAMVKTAAGILENVRALEAEEYCMPIKEILTLIPGGS